MATANNQKKNNKQLPLILGAAVIAVIAIAAVVFTPGGGSAGGAGKTQTIRAGEELVIDASAVTEEASFYPVEVDGTAMEVLAIRDLSGNVRTAFNTCQSCYTSGKGYYQAEGTELVCQNCGFRFTAEEVQVEGGGCNPYPIFPENKTEENGKISIGYDFLKASQDIFANWPKH